MAEIILFIDKGFGGLHTHLFQSTPDFTQLKLAGVNTGLPDNVTWNDVVSSFVIVSGTWQFFRDINYQTPVGNQPSYGPGVYSWVEDVGIPNDGLSSVRVIG